MARNVLLIVFVCVCMYVCVSVCVQAKKCNGMAHSTVVGSGHVDGMEVVGEGSIFTVRGDRIRVRRRESTFYM